MSYVRVQMLPAGPDHYTARNVPCLVSFVLALRVRLTYAVTYFVISWYSQWHLVCYPCHPVSYTHLTLPTILRV